MGVMDWGESREDIEKFGTKVIAERMRKGLPTAELQQALNDSKTGRGRPDRIHDVVDKYMKHG